MDTDNLFLNPEENRDAIRRLIRQALSETVPGEFTPHKDYPVYCTKAVYTRETMTEGLPLLIDHLPDVVLNWAGISDRSITPEDLLILDLETTGLRRGGGMLAFLTGVGYFEGDTYVVEQFFLPEPEAEFKVFDLILDRLNRKPVLVTFNGKTFDLPVLESRFLHNRLYVDLRSRPHIDLLHLARRLWKKKVPSCALESLEYYILGHIRDAELDIEGELIPQTYFQFLINGDPELLRRIFLHNQTDVLHTASLLALICAQIDYPLPNQRDIRIDYHAVGKLYHSQQRIEEALHILTALTDEDYVTPDLVYDLGIIHKKEKQWDKAEHFFRQGTDLLHNLSMLELCILLEKKKNYDSALLVSEALCQKILADPFQDVKKRLEVEKRIARLQAKLNKLLITQKDTKKKSS